MQFHISSQTLHRAVCLMLVSLTVKKYEGTLRYLMKNEAVYLSRTGLTWYEIVSLYVLGNLCGMRKGQEWTEDDVQVSDCLYWIGRVGEELMYVDCASTVFTVKMERRLKQNSHITFILELQELKQTWCLLPDYIYKVTNVTEYFVSFNRELIQLQRIISWWTSRNDLVPHIIHRFRWGFT